MLRARPVDPDKPTNITHALTSCVLGPPQRCSIPVLALRAQTSYRTCVAAVRRGTCPTLVLAARGGPWWLPADRPVRSVYFETNSERREWYRVGQGAHQRVTRVFDAQWPGPRLLLFAQRRGHRRAKRRRPSDGYAASRLCPPLY